VNTVCRDKTVIQGATDFMQHPELCEQWTIYTIFYIMHAIHRPKFIIKIGEHFSRINQLTRVQNFISLNLKKKSMRYAFFLRVSNKIWNPSKKFRQAALFGGI